MLRLTEDKGAVLLFRCGKCGREAQLSRAAVKKVEQQVTGVRFELWRNYKCKQCGDRNNVIYQTCEREQPQTSPSSSPSSPPPLSLNNLLKCPRCNSTQLHAGDKGFSLGKAAAGGLLIGGVGLLGGMIGSKKTMITCLNCGKRWQAGKKR